MFSRNSHLLAADGWRRQDGQGGAHCGSEAVLNLPEDNVTSYKIIKILFIRIKQSRPQRGNLSEALRGEDGAGNGSHPISGDSGAEEAGSEGADLTPD